MREEMQRYFKTMFVTNVYKEGMEDTDFSNTTSYTHTCLSDFYGSTHSKPPDSWTNREPPKPLRYHYVKGR